MAHQKWTKRIIVTQAVVETEREGNECVEVEELVISKTIQLEDDKDNGTVTPRNNPRVIKVATPVRVPTPQIGENEKTKRKTME